MGDSVRLLAVIGLYQWDQDSSLGGFCEITGCHWSLSVGSVRLLAVTGLYLWETRQHDREL